MSKTTYNWEDSDETVTLPQTPFLCHVLGLAAEGPIEYHCSDEVREQIGYQDVLSPSDVVAIEKPDHGVVIHLDTEASVSELVRRAKRNPPGAAHPAEYRNHDVPVNIVVELDWPDPENADWLPQTQVLVEQVEYPTESQSPPAPDVDAHRYDL